MPRAKRRGFDRAQDRYADDAQKEHAAKPEHRTEHVQRDIDVVEEWHAMR